MTKLTKAQAGRLGGYARAQRLTPGERSLQAARANDAWMAKYGKGKLIEMGHQRQGQLPRTDQRRRRFP